MNTNSRVKIMKLQDTIQRTLSVFGYKIQRINSRDEIKIAMDLINLVSAELVLDLGANWGQFALSIRKAGYRKQIHSYEPDPEVNLKLQRRSKRDKEWHVFEEAITSKFKLGNGFRILRVANNSGYSSSLREPTEGFSKIYNHIRFNMEKRVKVADLEKVLSRTNVSAIHLKLDIQGSERDVFDGVDLIKCKQIKSIQIEVSHSQLYEDEWSLSEALKYFSSSGFGLFAFSVEDYNSKTGVVQSNLYFLRVGS